MNDLPAHVLRDLARAAAGEGRTATTAHPDCTCVTEFPAASFDEIEAATREGREPMPDAVIRQVTEPGRRTCPQHGKIRRT